jgi:hypothetical protein
VTVTRVELPPDCRPPFEVFVNGVPQTAGRDYRRDGRAIVFERSLAKEGKLGFWRWFWGAWGIGSYRKNDVVDVRYDARGRPTVAHDLPFSAPTPAPGRPGPTGGGA